ncbi:MAG: riboflavin kinase, partial [Gemmatimonadetes bacterium]|nr:riboflavin kinase [Gemmatimonadota bacterium]
GRIALAGELLGRPYSVMAPVVRGAGRGAALGVPTVNLALDPRKQMPPDGIYACFAEVRDRWLPAAVHWGGRPTFGESAPMLEAHLVGFDASLYGERVEVAFLERLRDVRAFADAASLTRAMREDIRLATAVVESRFALQTGEGG